MLFRHVSTNLWKVFLAGGLNAEEKKPCLSQFLTSYDSESLVKDKTCFKDPGKPRCIDA